MAASTGTVRCSAIWPASRIGSPPRIGSGRSSSWPSDTPIAASVDETPTSAFLAALDPAVLRPGTSDGCGRRSHGWEQSGVACAPRRGSSRRPTGGSTAREPTLAARVLGPAHRRQRARRDVTRRLTADLRGRISRVVARRDRLAGPRPVAVRADVEDRVRQAGDAHRERVVHRGHAAAARGDDRPPEPSAPSGREARRAARPASGTGRRAEVAVDRARCGPSGCGRRPGRSARSRRDSAAGARASSRTTDPSRPRSSSRVDDAASTRSARWSDAGGQRRDVVVVEQGPPAAVQAAMPAVEDARRAMAEVVEHPPQPRGDPAADVVVGDDEVVVADPDARQAAANARGSGRGWRPGRRAGGREIVVEVEEDRAREVTRVVGRATGAGLAEVPAARRRSGGRGRSSCAAQVLGARSGARCVGTGESSSARERSVAGPCYPVARRDALGARPRDRPRPVPSLRRSSVVERAAVNRLVVGSSPTAGATRSRVPPSVRLNRLRSRRRCSIPAVDRWSFCR